MGWTSREMPPPDRQTLDRIVDEEIHSPNYEITMRSPWAPTDPLGRTHRFSLIEYHDDIAPNLESRSFIAVTLAEYHQEELFIKHITEGDGPLIFNCPSDILDRADKFPPSNNTALEWRAQCRRT